MWNRRALMPLVLMGCVCVAEVLSDGGSGARRGGLVWARASADGPACWGPGVWPHPAHCRLFSVCRMSPEEGIKGMLFLCPPKMLFSTRRGRCFADRSTCSQKPLPQQYESSAEVLELKTINARNYRCRVRRPFCASGDTLTVCAPNFSLIGNVTCAGSCKQEKNGASCVSLTTTTNVSSQSEDTTTTTTITTAAPITTSATHGTTRTIDSTRFITTTTTQKYEIPALNSELMDSAMKITSSLGLKPDAQTSHEKESVSPSDSTKPHRQDLKAAPAYAAPVFDFNSSPDEDSYETEQSEEEKRPFSKPVVVQASNIPVTAKPSESDDKESQIFTVELVRPVFVGVHSNQRPQGSVGSTGERPTPSETSGISASVDENPDGHQQVEVTVAGQKGGEDKMKLEEEEERRRLEMEKIAKEIFEKERLEKERLEKERLEEERLEIVRLEKERLENEKLERERLEKLEREKLEEERMEKERLEKDRLEKERLEKERTEKERLENLENERLEKERLEKERLEKLEKERLEKERFEKERLQKERLEKERLENERLEKEKLEKERLEKERLEEERLEKERLEKLEQERLEKERLEKLDKERLEKESLEKESLEKERLEKERLEKERLEKERLEKERLEKLEQERLEKERLEKLDKERLEKERLEKERLEKERLEKERLEKLEQERLEKERLEKLDKERLEKERLEKERLEKERLEKERLEKERLEKERLEKERLEKERLEKERLEKERLEKERLEKERLEKEKLKNERLEKERLEKLEKEKLEKQKLEEEKIMRDKLERERIEKEKLEKEKLEKEKIEKEKKEKEKLERERLEKEGLEKERLEKEKLAKEKSEREKLEKEKAEREKLDQERLEKEMEKLQKEKEALEKQEHERLEMEKWEKENQKYDLEDELPFTLDTSHLGTQIEESYLSNVCTMPGLLCANSKTLIECSSGLVPLRAWDCGAFFSRSATLMAKCDPEKVGCVATVEEGLLPTEGESESDSHLCKRPGPQCADSATLLHCSDDMRSATIAVCEDLFPRGVASATCDSELDACVVGIGEDGEYSGDIETAHTTYLPTTPTPVIHSTALPTTTRPPYAHTPKPTTTTTKAPPKPTRPPVTYGKRNQSTTQPHVSFVPTTNSPPPAALTDAAMALFPTMRNPCRRPGLRCIGGRILEACEKDNPKPVYKMDCSRVLANSLDARCEEHSVGEATCMVVLRRSTTSQQSAGQKNGQTSPENDVFTLELSVVDVTKTFDYADAEIPSWNCSRVGQYCADDSTLLSCNPDFSLEFALSCGAIAPDSVIAFCDYGKDACVVKKITDITKDSPDNNSSAVIVNDAGARPQIVPPVNSLNVENSASNQGHGDEMETFPSHLEWDFSTISQLYPPDVPVNAYGINRKPTQENKPPSSQSGQQINFFKEPPGEQSSTAAVDAFSPGYLKKCTKSGPICLDSNHLGSCSNDLELQYILPCSALYSSDPTAVCDSHLSACLPSSSKTTTTTPPPPTTTTTAPTTTTTPTPAPPKPDVYPNLFAPQQIPSYLQYPYMSPTINAPQIPLIQENQFPQPIPGTVTHPALNQYIRPTTYGLFQRPFVTSRPSQQQSRLPSFLQNILQNYGIRLPSSSQGARPGFFQNLRPSSMGSYPILSSIFQGTGNPNPTQASNTHYKPEDLGEEPYDFEDPHYVHPEGLPSHGISPHNRFSPNKQQPQEQAKTPTSLINPTFYQEILQYLKMPEQTSTPQQNAAFHRPQEHGPPNESQEEANLDRYLTYLSVNNLSPGNKVWSSGNRPSHGDRNGYHQDKTSQQKVPQSSNFQAQGSISQVNPLTWVDKVELDGVKGSDVCKRPGMQCIDSNSLGACSPELVLQYVIPCRHLLPFIKMGKTYCDERNDACGILATEEPPEYPTDYTSYP